MYYLSLLVLSWDNFKYQPKVGDGCHDLMQNAMTCNDGAIVSVKGNDYRTNFVVYQ